MQVFDETGGGIARGQRSQRALRRCNSVYAGGLTGMLRRRAGVLAALTVRPAVAALWKQTLVETQGEGYGSLSKAGWDDGGRNRPQRPVVAHRDQCRRSLSRGTKSNGMMTLVRWNGGVGREGRSAQIQPEAGRKDNDECYIFRVKGTHESLISASAMVREKRLRRGKVCNPAQVCRRVMYVHDGNLEVTEGTVRSFGNGTRTDSPFVQGDRQAGFMRYYF
nr:hypothetical protein CFP56_37376 [Quercus suber]